MFNTVNKKLTPEDIIYIIKNNILFILKCIVEAMLYALVPYLVVGILVVALYLIIGLTLEQVIISIIIGSLFSCFCTIIYLISRVR